MVGHCWWFNSCQLLNMLMQLLHFIYAEVIPECWYVISNSGWVNPPLLLFNPQFLPVEIQPSNYHSCKNRSKILIFSWTSTEITYLVLILPLFPSYVRQKSPTISPPVVAFHLVPAAPGAWRSARARAAEAWRAGMRVMRSMRPASPGKTGRSQGFPEVERLIVVSCQWLRVWEIHPVQFVFGNVICWLLIDVLWSLHGRV